jgi:hypothetical protein
LPKVLKEAQQKEEQQQEGGQDSQAQPPGLFPGTAAAGKAGAAAAVAKPIPVPEVHSQEVINYWNMTDSIIDTMFKR